MRSHGRRARRHRDDPGPRRGQPRSATASTATSRPATRRRGTDASGSASRSRRRARRPRRATYALERIDNGVRVRIGDADVILPPGRAHLRASATARPGSSASSTIMTSSTGTSPATAGSSRSTSAEARIRLPAAAPFGERAVYTGPQGSTASNAEVVPRAAGRDRLPHHPPLGPRGRPDRRRRLAEGRGRSRRRRSAAIGWWLADYGPLGAALARPGRACRLSIIYAWKRAGRGPEAGTIVPLFSPPDGLSAAAMRYIRGWASTIAPSPRRSSSSACTGRSA